MGEITIIITAIIVFILLFPVIVQFIRYLGEVITPAITDFLYYYREAWKDTIALIFKG